ncbi:MAG TPA: hypothetical protein PLH57_06935 [Oligoflexia bacterium]|nr:hypothetical protein [Oligoflexia bacterium]
MTSNTSDALPISGIGSLPHHNVDAALEYSFRFDIPFFPQIPLRNPNEYMLPQALHGLPGLVNDSEGSVTLDLLAWKSGKDVFSDLLDQGLRNGITKPFELSTEYASCWKPFLWEIIERKQPLVKIQIAGPLTCQWALRMSDQTPVFANPDVASQVLKLVTLRAQSMIETIQKTGAHTIIYLDEPALFALDVKNPKHILALGELRLLIGALKKMGATVGLHCCSNTDWKAVLSLDLDILSLDVALSLDGLTQHHRELDQFVADGRRLSLGIVSTNENSESTSADQIAGILRKLPPRALSQALLTPACGLAFKAAQECEHIYTVLREYQTTLLRKVIQN